MKDWNKKRVDIGVRIEALREEKGMTQAELAAAMSVLLQKSISRETVKQWERGERDLKTEATVALSDFFGTNCDYLLRGIDSQNIDICKETGLSNATVNKLIASNNQSPFTTPQYMAELINTIVLGDDDYSLAVNFFNFKEDGASALQRKNVDISGIDLADLDRRGLRVVSYSQAANNALIAITDEVKRILKNSLQKEE